MIAGDVGDHLDFFDRKSGQVAVRNEIITVLMVLARVDGVPHVMEQRGIFQPFALLIIHAMEGVRLVEQRRGQLRHVMRMRLGVVTASGQGHDVPQANIRNFLLDQ